MTHLCIVVLHMLLSAVRITAIFATETQLWPISVLLCYICCCQQSESQPLLLLKRNNDISVLLLHMLLQQSESQPLLLLKRNNDTSLYCCATYVAVSSQNHSHCCYWNATMTYLCIVLHMLLSAVRITHFHVKMSQFYINLEFIDRLP